MAKKYRSFVDDYNTFLDELEQNPFSGTLLGNSTYMYRMAIALKGKGKKQWCSSHPNNVQQTEDDIAITLMSIYDKSEIARYRTAICASC